MKKPFKLKVSDIVEEITVCPYCMDEKVEHGRGCCGESSCHFAKAYVTKDACYLEHEVEVVK